MASAFTVIIPARYASTRLPGKPLLDIGGKPMVVRVAQRALASGATAVYVATDDPRIEEACRMHGVKTYVTSADHATGTDRLVEVVSRPPFVDDDIVVNVQGDEPLIDPELIRGVAELLTDQPLAAMATACHEISDRQDFFNPNVVKVVCQANGLALYFSRAPIPYARDEFGQGGAHGARVLPYGLPAYRHIGIYAYRVRFLRAYALLEPVAIERFEALEQLRALAHGYTIAVRKWNAPMPGVDTAEDLQSVRQLFEATNRSPQGQA